MGAAFESGFEECPILWPSDEFPPFHPSPPSEPGSSLSLAVSSIPGLPAIPAPAWHSLGPRELLETSQLHSLPVELGCNLPAVGSGAVILPSGFMMVARGQGTPRVLFNWVLSFHFNFNS